MEFIQILGVKVHLLDISVLHQKIAEAIFSDDRLLVLNTNVHCLNLAYRYKWLNVFLNDAQIVFCDGFGVRVGARILGYHLPQRITYADWTWQLSEFAASRSFTFFFLGARPGVADKAASRLNERLPDLHIVGTHHGYFDKAFGSHENEEIVHKINAVKPNILIVGFGMPAQEQWLMENWDRIRVNVALTGGAVFDYVSGELRRPPRWMTDRGFEWLGRLIIEPGRLWRRYLIGNPLFIYRVMKQRLGLLNFEVSQRPQKNTNI